MNNNTITHFFDNEKLNTFKKNNPHVDFLTNQFHSQNTSHYNWQTLHAEEMLPHLRTYQRILRIHPDDAIAQKLLQHGFDSAHRITVLSKRKFIAQYYDAFEQQGELLKQIYHQAHAIKTRAILAWAHIKDTVASPHYRTTLFNNLDPKFVDGMKDIPGYQELFGRLEFCTAEECQSILGAPAYFFDLMRMVEDYIHSGLFFTLDLTFEYELNTASTLKEAPKLQQAFANYGEVLPDDTKIIPLSTGDIWKMSVPSITNPRHFLIEKRLSAGYLDVYTENAAIPVGHYLTERRPDLLDIPLDCDNTFTEVSYLSIVNNVVAKKILSLEKRQESITEFMAQTLYPFVFPYNEPLAEIHAYLQHFKLDLATVYRTVQRSGSDNSLNIAREYLQLSPEQYAIVTTSLAENPEKLTAYYGVENLNSPDLGGLRYLDEVPPAKNLIPFLNAANLTHQQFDSLLFEDLTFQEQEKNLQQQFFINQADDSLGSLSIEWQADGYRDWVIIDKLPTEDYFPTNIAASSDGTTLWVVANHSKPGRPIDMLWLYEKYDGQNYQWREFKSSITQLGLIDVNNDYALLSGWHNEYILHLVNKNTGVCQKITPPTITMDPISITISSGLYAWFITKTEIYSAKLNPKTEQQNWQKLTPPVNSGTLQKISAGDDDDIWLLAADGKLFSQLGDTWLAAPSLPEGNIITDISVGVKQMTYAVTYNSLSQQYRTFLLNRMNKRWYDIDLTDSEAIYIAAASPNSAWANVKNQKLVRHWIPAPIKIIKNLSIAKLDRINRFMRLAAYLQWSYADLDWALHCIANYLQKPIAIDSEVIKQLAQIKYLQNTYQISITNICSLFYVIRNFGKQDANSPKDLFDEIYNVPNLLALGITPWSANTNIMPLIEISADLRPWLLYESGRILYLYRENPTSPLTSPWFFIDVPPLPQAYRAINIAAGRKSYHEDEVWVIGTKDNAPNQVYRLLIEAGVWESVPTESINFIQISVGNNGQLVWATASDGFFYQWNENNQQWLKIEPSLPEGKKARYASISRDEARIWVLSQDHQVYQFQTIDGNNSWQSHQTGLPADVKLQQVNAGKTSGDPNNENLFVVGLDSTGRLWQWNINNTGEWGPSKYVPKNNDNQTLPVTAVTRDAFSFEWLITHDQQMYAFSYGEHDEDYSFHRMPLPVAVWQTINTYRQEDLMIRNRLLAALALQDEELTAISDRIHDAYGNIILTLDNLSLLYRLSVLPRLANLSVIDTLYLIDLVKDSQQSIADFTHHLKNILTLLTWAKQVKASGFTINELNYIVAPNPSIPITVSSFDTEYFYILHSKNNVLTLLNTLATILQTQYKEEIPDNFSKFPEALQLLFIATFNDFFQVDNDVFKLIFNGYLLKQFNLAKLFKELLNESANPLKPLTAIPQDWLIFLINTDRLVLLANRLKFSPIETDALLNNPTYFNMEHTCFHSLSIEDIDHLITYNQLKAAFKDVNDRLISDYFPAQVNSNAQANILASISGWPANQIADLIHWLWPSNQPTELRMSNSVQGVNQLKAAFDIANTLAVDIQFVINLANTDPLSLINGQTTDKSLSWYQNLATSLLTVLKAKYDAQQWQDIFNLLNKQLSERKRDVLLPYLIWCLNPDYFPDNNPSFPITSVQDLYDYLLLDPEMSGCAITSNIKQAISSVQLYIQRTKMSLEPGIQTNAIPENIWQWAKSYPVWQANRKVFLYPETYIEPSLRKIKSSLYEELESQLSQMDISDANVIQAYKGYLDKFAELANLIISGSYVYHDLAYDQKTLLLLGRTNTSPYTYYHRNYYYNDNIWTPWKKIEVPIAASYVAPVYVTERLFLFWVTVSQVTNAVIDNNNQKDNTTWRSTVHYMYYDYNQQWSQPQTVWEDETIIVKQSPGNETLDVNDIFWNRIYPLYDETNQIITLLYGPYTIPYTGTSFSNTDNNRNGTNALKLTQKTLSNNLLITRWTYLKSWEHNSNKKFGIHIESPTNAEYSKLTMMETYNRVYDNYYGDSSNYYKDTKGETSLFSAISLKTATLQTIKNQTGWYVLNNGDQTYLLTSSYTYPTITDPRHLDIRYQPTAQYGDPANIILPRIHSPAYPDDLTFKAIRLSTNVVPTLSKALFRGGIDELLSLTTQQSHELSFAALGPNRSKVFGPANDTLDFNGAYGLYFQEIFFFIPFLIANRLHSNQRFKEAQRWYQYIFNPTITPTANDPTPQAYWRYLPLRNLQPSTFATMLTDKATIRLYENDPFDPDSIAALRPSAYQKALVMKYIDNLLSWGDNLFIQDTWESLNEATLLYIMAQDLLGPRPKNVDTCKPTVSKTTGEIFTYYEQQGKPIPEFVINLENTLPSIQDNNSLPSSDNPNLDYDWYFHIVENPDFLAYWDKVADRLYKIRHCMNMAGIKRQLRLFEPPINPRALIQAAANGDMSTGVGITQALLPPYRFGVALEKAKATTYLVVQLGSELLSALEKRDSEQLVALNLSQQKILLQLTNTIKADQEEAMSETLAGLQFSLNSAQARYQHYGNLLKNGWSTAEIAQLTSGALASTFSTMNSVMQGLAGLSFLVPQVGSPFAMTYGGQQMGNNISSLGNFFGAAANVAEAASILSATIGNFQRRDEDWELQKTLADYDMQQLEKQIAATQRQLSITKQEAVINEKSILQNDELMTFYREKFTSQELYQWLATRLTVMYFQAYQLAVGLALGAEQAYQFELLASNNYIDLYAWNNLRGGLLAGEKLLFNLQQLDTAYATQNTRRLEITKVISLRKLLGTDSFEAFKKKLINDEPATFSLKEEDFNHDYCGHYQRLIKTLSISIPAVIGPYENIHAILTQTQGEVVVQPDINAVKYLLNPLNLDRPNSQILQNHCRSNQQIAISSGVNDAGMFTLNFGDERYLPFEYNGVISQWTLDMPKKTNAQWLENLSDIIITLSYTALVGNEKFKAQVAEAMEENRVKIPYQGKRLISFSHEFPQAWNLFLHPQDTASKQTLSFNLAPSSLQPKLRACRVTQVGLKMQFSNTISRNMNITLPINLLIPQRNSSTNKPLLEFVLSSQQDTAIHNTDIVCDGDRPWLISIAKSAIPKELKNQEGFLDANRVQHLGISFNYEEF